MPEAHADVDFDDAFIDLGDSFTRVELVRSIWCEVLRIREIGDDVTFLEAGGNSLLLAALAEKLSSASGRKLQTEDLLRAPSVKGQAELLAPQAPGAV